MARTLLCVGPLVPYLYLQLLDLLTTCAFLVNGRAEGNPLVRCAMNAGPTPLIGLAAVKVAAVGIGIFSWYTGRMRVLQLLNVIFAAAVVWNMIAVITGSVRQS